MARRIIGKGSSGTATLAPALLDRLNKAVIIDDLVKDGDGKITNIGADPVGGEALTAQQLADLAKIPTLEASQAIQDGQLATVDLADNGDGSFTWTKPDGTTQTVQDSELMHSTGVPANPAPATREICVDDTTDEIYYKGNDGNWHKSAGGTPSEASTLTNFQDTDPKYSTPLTHSPETIADYIESAKNVRNFVSYGEANAAGVQPRDTIFIIGMEKEVWARTETTGSFPFPGTGDPDANWFRIGDTAPDPQSLLLDNIEVGIRSAGTNAGSNISLTFVDKDGIDYPASSWAVSLNLVQYSGGTATILTDKALYNGTIGVGRNKQGIGKFYYTGENPNGLSEIRIDATTSTTAQNVVVTYQGTNYNDSFAALADITELLYWTTSGNDKATDQGAPILENIAYAEGDVVSFLEPDNTDPNYGELFNWKVLPGQEILDTEITDATSEAELIAIKPKLSRSAIGTVNEPTDTVAYPGDNEELKISLGNSIYLDTAKGALPTAVLGKEISVLVKQSNSTDLLATKQAADAIVTHYHAADHGAGPEWVLSRTTSTTDGTEYLTIRDEFLGTSGKTWTITLPPNSTLIRDRFALGNERLLMKYASGTKVGQSVQDTSGVNYNPIIDPNTLVVSVGNNLPQDVTDISLEFGVTVKEIDFEAWTDEEKARVIDSNIKNSARDQIPLVGHTINIDTYAITNRKIYRVTNNHSTNNAVLYSAAIITDSEASGGNTKSINQNSRHELIIPPKGWVDVYRLVKPTATQVVWVADSNEVLPTGPAVERVMYQRNRGQTMNFGDLQFWVPNSGNSSFQFRYLGGGSITISDFLTHWSHQQGGASEESISFALGSSFRYFRTQGLTLTQHNNFQEAMFECNGWMYHVEVIVGGSWQNNRFSFTRWRLEGIKGDAGNDGVDGIDGVDGRSIITSHRSDGTTAIGGTVYTLDHIIYEYSDNTYEDMGFLVAPAAQGIQTVELASYDGAHTAGQSFTLAGGRTWQDVLDEFQFVYVLVGANNLFSHDQSRQWHVDDLSVQSIDMAITDYQTHGSNSYHYKMRCPASSSTTVTIDNDNSNMTAQRIRVRGIK